MSDSGKVLWPGWETVRLIGRGSFGTVYEIERNMFGDVEKAALKEITIPQSSSDIDELYGDGYSDESITRTFQAYMKDIIAEYSLMRKMNGSANVVNCDDVRYTQHDDGFGWDIFIKMELLTPITKALDKEMSDEQVIRIGADICKALMLCRKHNIIHRDIKPANIFVSENGDYKLGDFGIAKTVEKTSGGTKIGTYEYMAPEVYHDQPYGSTVDIYSLGMVLYWLLNERRTPFLKMPPAMPTSSEKEQARKSRFSGESLPAPAHGSEELKRIVLKACAYDPKDRYQSAEEMLRDLRALNEDIYSNNCTQEIYAESAKEDDDATISDMPIKTETIDSADSDQDGSTVSPFYEKHTEKADNSNNEKKYCSSGENGLDNYRQKTGSNRKKIRPWYIIAAICVFAAASLTILIFSFGKAEPIPVPTPTPTPEQPTPEPSVESISDHTAISSAPVSGGYAFEGRFGISFYVPAGFLERKAENGVGYLYNFYNDSLDMSISVSETAFAEINSNDSPPNIINKEFENESSLYESIKDCWKNNSWAESSWQRACYDLTGWINEDTIFYIRLYNRNDEVLSKVNITYPEANKEICDGILVDLLSSIDYPVHPSALDIRDLAELTGHSENMVEYPAPQSYLDNYKEMYVPENNIYFFRTTSTDNKYKIGTIPKDTVGTVLAVQGTRAFFVFMPDSSDAYKFGWVYYPYLADR